MYTFGFSFNFIKEEETKHEHAWFLFHNQHNWQEEVEEVVRKEKKEVLSSLIM